VHIYLFLIKIIQKYTIKTLKWKNNYKTRFKLFTSVINNDKHVLSHILPDPNNHTYNLRPTLHKLTLAIKGDAKNVFETKLFKDIYWSLQFRILYFIFYSLYCVVFFRFYCAASFWQRILHIKLNWIEMTKAMSSAEKTRSELST